MARTRSLSLPVAAPFELRLVLFGHGWIDLAPHVWDETNHRWTTTFHSEDGVAEVEVVQRGSGLEARVEGTAGSARVKQALRRMLRLDLDLEPFWQLCDRDPRLRWVRPRGGGRLLRSAHAFEDLMKLLFTTNCSWAATKLMTQRLVDALGQAGPSGRKAFPGPKACASKDESFWRDVVRVGYRAKAARLLARGFADGTLDDTYFTDADIGADELRERLLGLEGFGPYAAGQALRLFGHHEDLALDSWCRATWTKLRKKRRPPSDAAIAREYRHFGTWQGLALWLDLTAKWHRPEQVEDRAEPTIH